MNRPQLLLLDEPSLGLAPILVSLIFDTIRKLKGEGTTILLVEQNARLALDVADRAYVLEKAGYLQGPAKELSTIHRWSILILEHKIDWKRQRLGHFYWINDEYCLL